VRPSLPFALQPIIACLIDHGIKPVLVGGYLRDLLLHTTQSKDIDIELYNVTSLDQLIGLLSPFSKLHEVGKSFGVLKLTYQGYELDFSLPRSEHKTAEGHRGFEITTYQSVDFKTAASRRDFTVNAMGFDLETHLFLDPYHGKKDLKNRILRCVNPLSFVEDPLRLFRALGFCARFKLTCKEELILLCQKMAQEDALHSLPKERIFEELKKLLLRSESPSIGFKLLIKMKALSFFPELESLDKQQFDETLVILDTLAQSSKDEDAIKLKLLIVVLVSRFKSKTDVISFITSLTNEKKFLESVVALYSAYQQLPVIQFSDARIRRLALHVKIEELCEIARADKTTAPLAQALFIRAKALHVSTQSPKALLQGRNLIALGMKPSKNFSKLLEDAFEAQLDGEFHTLQEAKLWLANKVRNISN